jgi:hypothetical protein
MDRPTRIAIMPVALVLCGLTGCVVEGPPPARQVVVERPPQQVVVERPPPPPPPVYRPQQPEVILRP